MPTSPMRDPMRDPVRHPAGRRLLWASAVAVAVVATALAIPSAASRTGDLRSALAASRTEAAPQLARAADGHAHDHNDPATKNAISRGGETSKDAQDPTTAEEVRRSTAYVAAQRRQADPPLTTAPGRATRLRYPQNRYAMAGGCYTLQTGPDVYVKRSPDGLVLKELSRIRRATRFTFQATDLGTYLLYGRRHDFASGPDRVTMATEPSADAEWTVAKVGNRAFTLGLGEGGHLAVNDADELVVAEQATRFTIRMVNGCRAYPEAEVNVSGAPHAGVTSYQEVRGYVDAHTHGMAFEFLGGGVHCGRPWHEYGAPAALVDCEDHSQTQGHGAVLESLLSGEPSHDPVGWPTFADWPAPNSLTHEGTYYKWMERAWRGGERIFVNLLVENNKLCQLYPLPAPTEKNSCDDMDSIRLQAQDMYRFQDYIDAQAGGPGKGWYRIVTSPWEARKVVNQGKLAVVMGIETSIPFGCTMRADVPECDAASITRQLDEVHEMGVRQMELVNKFDNALSGVAGDTGEVGAAVNGANFAETGSFWDMRHCEPENPEAHDKNQVAAPEISADQQDALFGAIGQLFGAAGTALPVYPPPDHCNERGLTTLGEHTVNELAKRHMLFDPDHMSVKARNAALDQVEAMGYPGVLSSHSWSTPDAYPRIYELGGFIAPYAGDSTGFVEKWRRHLGWADDRYYFGIGFGADMNGLGAQGDPRGADVPNPVTYPFPGLGGTTIAKQRAGERVWDINVDGVAQYGLYPDWVEDLRKVAGNDGTAIADDMARGAEAYLQTWERAEGIAADSCRNPGLRRTVSAFRIRVAVGMSTEAVMRAVGQPFTRLGREFTYCAKTGSDPKVKMTVAFTRKGRVSGLTG